MKLSSRLPRETGREYALRVIKENIVCLELAPGSMVSENELAAELGLSRTPVREALIELSKVKIVEIYPQKGSFVARIDHNLVEESQFMRNVLECAVAELLCSVATEADLAALEESLELQRFYAAGREREERTLELDNQFHQLLFSIARKEQVYSMMRNIAIHFDRVRNLTLSDVEVRNVIRDHQAITDAIAQRDPALARTRVEEHLGRYRVYEHALKEKYPHFFVDAQESAHGPSHGAIR